MDLPKINADIEARMPEIRDEIKRVFGKIPLEDYPKYGLEDGKFPQPGETKFHLLVERMLDERQKEGKAAGYSDLNALTDYVKLCTKQSHPCATCGAEHYIGETSFEDCPYYMGNKRWICRHCRRKEIDAIKRKEDMYAYSMAAAFFLFIMAVGAAGGVVAFVILNSAQ